MIYRPARSIDAPALVDILKERHAETRYGSDVRIDEVIARKVFAHAAQRHGGTNEGAMFLMVAEQGDGTIDAFMLGHLARIYMVGDKLVATDLFLIGHRNCDPRCMNGLIEHYLAWAEENPKVHEIVLSWSDAVPESGAINALYERKGFTLCGTSYRRDARVGAERNAA